VDKTRRKLQGELKLLQELLADKDSKEKASRRWTRPGGSFRESSITCRSFWLIRTGKEKTSRRWIKPGGSFRESSSSCRSSWLIRTGKEKTSRRWIKPGGSFR
jgi:hypothetical protein